MEPGGGIQYDFDNRDDRADSADEEEDDIGTIWRIRERKLQQLAVDKNRGSLTTGLNRNLARSRGILERA